MRKAFITGINGQDGSYLAEFLLEKGYEVHGLIRRNSAAESQTVRIDHIKNDLHLYYGDMLDIVSLMNILKKVKPDEIYNLAAQSHVKISFDEPIYTTEVIAIGIINLLEAIKIHCPSTKLYQASSSEMFGNSIDNDGYQRESTPMYPVSPYGCAKLFAYSIVKNYRQSYGMFLSNGILFNHESPRRGINFVTNKVVKEAVKIKLGLTDKLSLGNLNSSRDWGHTKDYVYAMWLILQSDTPDDFVCATGVNHTVKELVEYVFNKLELDSDKYIIQDKKYLRANELHYLRGDSTKIRNVLGWAPKYSFEEMLDEMIGYWLKHYSK